MARTATAAAVVKFPGRRIIKLDDGPATVKLCQDEIWRSGKTYKTIGYDAELDQSTIAKIAHGETKRPAQRTVARILMALGWTIYAEEGGSKWQ